MKYLLSVLFVVAGVCAMSQDSKYKEVEIQTSAQCGSCKTRIEDALNYMSGVKYAELDLETKKVTVKFNTKKTSLDAVKTKIAETGYDADDVAAHKEAYSALPACCQKGGHDND